MKEEPISPLFIRLGELIIPTIVSLALISSLILVYYVMTDTKNTDPTVNTPTPTVVDSDAFEIQVLKEGKGAQIKSGQTAEVNYVGTLKNGTKFDSSYDRKETFSFELGAGEVIKGWDKGVEGMKIGEKRKLIIPASLGYGSSGAGGIIPPNATLIFEVELVGIK